MKKLSSSLLLLFTVVFVLLSSGNARANRAAAGEIAYKWVSDSTYTLTYTFYRDCGGATAEPASVNLCYYNTCNTDKGNVTLSKKTPLTSNGQIVQAACSGTSSTTCSSPAGTLKGYRKWVYEGTVKLPSKCASWHFIVSISSRNAGITNYTVPPASSNMFSEATLNNVDAPTSSSPTFALDPIQYMCAGNKQAYNYGGVDADGDALSYTLIDPSSSADNQITCFIPPTPTSYVLAGAYSLPSNPFDVTTPAYFSLGLTTGAMAFTPTGAVAQQPIMTMLITKRRGTKVVGTITRELQFVISTGCTPSGTNFTYNKPSSTQVLWSATPVDTAIVCPNVAHRICFSIASPDPTVTISNITDNHLTFSPTSSTSTLPSPYPGAGTNNVSNCFDWTPNETDEGTKYLVVKSEVCKPGTPKVYRTDSIVIEIIKTVKIIPTDTFICFGDTTSVCMDPAGPAGDNDWTITTSGTGAVLGTIGITSPKDPCTTLLPTTTTTYLATTPTIRGFCKRKDFPALNTNQAQIKIVVVNPKIDAGPDTVMCVYSSLHMNANLLNPQPELTYSYKWTPGKWLSDSTVPNPTLTFPYGTDLSTVPDSIVFTLTCTPHPDTSCKKTDDLVVHILKGFYILTGDTLGNLTGYGYKQRQKGVSDTSICLGKSITLQGWTDTSLKFRGEASYTYIWNPSAGVSTPIDYQPGKTTITPTSTGTMTFSLTAARAGCPDSTKKINITVDPVPTADIGKDQTICFGDTLNLFATITPDPDVYTKYSYQWYPGGALARADTFFTYFTGFRTETIKFKVSTPAGCFAIDSATYTVQPRSFLTPGKDVSICPGDTTQISVAGDALLKTVTWKPELNIDSIHSLTPMVNPVYSIDYVVIGVDSNQCIDSSKVKVTVYPRTVIYLPDSVTIYPGQSYQLNPEGNSLYYTWFPPIGLDFPSTANPKASPSLNTMYTVKGVTDAGCTATDSIYIFVAPDSYIDIPNAFTPGHGENSVFKPVHLGDATLTLFSVYDRWGIKLFETKDLNQGWDGSYGGKPQPLGVYVYVLEAITANGRPISKQGNVTLIR